MDGPKIRLFLDGINLSRAQPRDRNGLAPPLLVIARPVKRAVAIFIASHQSQPCPEEKVPDTLDSDTLDSLEECHCERSEAIFKPYKSFQPGLALSINAIFLALEPALIVLSAAIAS